MYSATASYIREVKSVLKSQYSARKYVLRDSPLLKKFKGSLRYLNLFLLDICLQ